MLFQWIEAREPILGPKTGCPRPGAPGFLTWCSTGRASYSDLMLGSSVCLFVVKVEDKFQVFKGGNSISSSTLRATEFEELELLQLDQRDSEDVLSDRPEQPPVSTNQSLL